MSWLRYDRKQFHATAVRVSGDAAGPSLSAEQKFTMILL